jgi:RHS repeat-associated protein
VGSLGHPSEDDTGLVYMRARYYDPVLGRFASEDPARDSGNWLAYAANNPTSFLDRDGEKKWGIWFVWALLNLLSTGGDKSNAGPIVNLLRTRHKIERSIESFEGEIDSDAEGGDGKPKRKGLKGIAGGIGSVSSLDAYFKEDPLDFIDILLDIAGVDACERQLD